MNKAVSEPEKATFYGKDYPRIPIADIADAKSPIVVPFEGHDIPVRYQAGKSNDLVVLFHGAVRRPGSRPGKRPPPPPRFQDIIPGTDVPHQISISDPTILLSETLTASWYQGTPDFDVPAVLSRFIAALKAQIGITRTIYIGASSGGFAALSFAHGDPGSVAIVANPQTSLKRHSRPPTQAYYDAFWSNTCSYEEFLEFDQFDLQKLYSKSIPSTVIYVQGSGDRFHFFRQYAPFVAAVPSVPHFLSEVGFWGTIGHSGGASFKETVHRWFNAVMMSPDTDPNEILMNRRQIDLMATDAQSLAAGRTAASGARPPSEADVQMTERVLDWQLKKAKA